MSKSLYTSTWNLLVVICQKVMAFLVSGEKSKHRWNNIHTMAEAKAGLQALLNMVSISVNSLLWGFVSDRVLVGLQLQVGTQFFLFCAIHFPERFLFAPFSLHRN